MLPFDPHNPYPLFSEGEFSYRDEQLHSAEADTWLGLDTESVERRISASGSATRTEGDQHWIGLPVPVLLTPYTEIRRMLHELALAPGSRIVDLGAAYGRMGFVVARHFPGISFLGYECVRERVEEGSRRLKALSCTSAELKLADISRPEFRPAEAECYFIYDFGSRSAIQKALSDLKEIATRRNLMVIGRGRASRDAIERTQPWLSEVVRPMHFPHYSIYRTTPRV